MQADAGFGQEATAPLVAAAGAGIKAADAPLDRPGNRGVVTDLEVQVLQIHITAPVTAPEPLAILHAQRHRHRIGGIAAMGTEQHQIGAQLAGSLKEGLREVFAAPGPPAGAVLGIEVVHPLQQCRRNLFPHHRGHREAGGGHGGALAAHVAALIGIEASQIGLEIAETGVGPAALLVDPGAAAGRLSQGPPAGIHIEKIAAEQPVLAAEGIDQLQHHSGDRSFILPGGDQEAVALHRTEGAHPHELGVVAQPELAGELGE